MYEGWEWHTCIAPEGNVQRAIWIWASSKSFSQGFWPCHSTDRASGTFSAITASGATRTVKPKKTTDSRAGNRLIESLPIVGGRLRFDYPAATKPITVIAAHVASGHAAEQRDELAPPHYGPPSRGSGHDTTK